MSILSAPVSYSASRSITGETLKAMANPPWEGAEARILIVRLSPIRDVDRSSAHLILFAESRAAMPEAFIDFAFLPDREDRGSLGAKPWFFGATSGLSPAVFDLILVSNAFGLELVNLPRLMSTAGIPLLASARARLATSRDEGAAPVIVLGGSNAGQAASIVDEAGDSLVDGLFVGEGEGAIGPLARVLSDRKRPRAERLLTAAAIEGFWPALHPELKTRRRILAVSPPPLLSFPPLDTPEAKTARLQITAGCPGHCSFCFEGWDRRPYRELPLEAVLAAARELRARGGIETLEVYSFNFNTHADIFGLLYELGRIFKNVNLMSQRLDILADTPGLVAAELASGKRSFTLGVEGISRGMRAYYRKGLSDAQLEALLAHLVAPGVRELKLFYILAGFEGEEDIAEFAAFAETIARRRAERAPGLRILASAGYLVRLPGTPLAHAPLVLEEGPFASIADRLSTICGEAGIEWRIAVHFDEYCADQLISLAGGRLLPWYETLASAPPELVYDGSLPRALWPSLEAFSLSRGLLDEGFLGEKGGGLAPRLPFLEAGTEGRVLYREYLAAKARIDRKSCLGGTCADCGACPDPGSRAFLATHRIRGAERGLEGRLERLNEAKRNFAQVLVRVERPRSIAGASIVAQEAWLLADLASVSAGAWRSVFSARLLSPLPGEDFGAAEGSTGWSLFALGGPSAGGIATLARSRGVEVLEDYAIPERLAATIDLGAGATHSSGTMGGGAEDRMGDLRDILAAWLADSRIAATARRSGSAWIFDIAARDLPRRAVFSARVEEGRMRLTIGPKARLERLGVELGPGMAAYIAGRVELSLPQSLS